MSLDNLTGRATRTGRAQASQVLPAGGLVAATIATTPAGGERVDVLIGGDATQRTGPCVWSPVVIDGELFTPARDDPCFVTVARRGSSVVVWWEPGDGRAGVALDTAPAPASLATTGDVKWTARTTAPSGWLACDGTAVTVASGHIALRDALLADSSPYGVSGADPRVPDLRGRAPVGAGTGSGLTARSVGQSFGAEDHTLTTAQIPAHVHSLDYDVNVGAGAGGGGPAQPNTGTAYNTRSGGGTGGSHPNVQPSLCLLAVIKT